MRKKRGISIQVVILVLLLIVLAIVLQKRIGRIPNDVTYSEKRLALQEVAGELGFGVYTKEDWEAYFKDYPETYLTHEILNQILTKLGVGNYIKKPKGTGDAAVSRKDWNLVYTQILDYLDMAGEVTRETFLVLGMMQGKEESVIITNKGDYYTHLPITYLEQWNTYEVYQIRDRCVGILGISAEEMSIANSYLKTYTGGMVIFLYGGMEYKKEIGKIETELAPGVCDLVFSGGNITLVRRKQDVILGQLLSYDDVSIEIEGYGKIGHTGRIPVYQAYGEVVEKSISDVILGNMDVEYITGEGQVCAIIIGEPANIADIRVLLLAENGGNFRSDVYLKCSTSARIKCGEREEATVADIPIHVSEYLGENVENTFVFTPDAQKGKIFICDAAGNAVSNGYDGKMEVRSYAEGYTLVNELPFETYLCAVVPSEMPSTYELEALKAQAVCARSYAYIQLLRADLARYGAHINDSTSYQVYNKVMPTEASIAAVNQTSGKMLTYQGNIIEAYYFSTSMGYTTAVDIWNIGEEENYGYLKSVCLNTSPYEGNLADEAEFTDYIKSRPEGYDSDIKHYRWFAIADYRNQTETINGILRDRRSVSKENVLYYTKDGTTELETLDGMGGITEFFVRKRSSAGAILELQIQYENGMIIVKTEYNIRKVLGCGVQKIVYGDSSEGSNITMLPSAFCTVSKEADGSYLLQGGGYGHGLGMSQNGANGMARAGMNYEEILHYFYNDIEISGI